MRTDDDDHKENIRAHAARRFRERFGQDLTPKMRGAFHRGIETGRSCWLVAMQRAYPGKPAAEIYFAFDKSVSPEPIVMVFRRDWMEIVTFLTPDMYRRQVTGELAEARRERIRKAQDRFYETKAREGA